MQPQEADELPNGSAKGLPFGEPKPASQGSSFTRGQCSSGQQQLGCSMFRYLTETTDEEKLHVRRGTIDLLASHLKMRFVAPGDWVRIKFDLQHMVRQACGDAYLYSRRQAGELLHLIYLRPMRALGDTSLLSVFQQLPAVPK